MYRSLLAPIVRLTGYLAFGLVLLATVQPSYALAAPAVAVTAPGPVVMDRLDVSVEPEYDSTDVLVVYEASFINRGAQPYDGDLLFHVPKGVSPAGPTNEAHICQVEGTNRHAYCAPYRVDQGNDYLTFTWKARQPIPANGRYPIYIEYYYNPLRFSGTGREMTFQYHPAYPVESLNLTVLEPLRTTDFKLDPPPAQAGKETGGFKHFAYAGKNLQPGSTFGFKATYVKTDNRPSIPRQVGSGEQGAAGGGATSRNSLVALVGIMVALFGGVFMMANRRGARRNALRLPGKAHRAQARREGRPAGFASQTPFRGASSRETPGATQRHALPGPDDDRAQQKEAARRLLLAGKISEATYRDLVRDLDEDTR